MLAAAAAKSLQSYPTLCYPIDGRPPGSAFPGILQARTLGWVAFPSPMHESESESLSRVLLFATPWTAAYQAPLSMWILQARILEVDCCALLQGIFLTQGSHPGT